MGKHDSSDSDSSSGSDDSHKKHKKHGKKDKKEKKDKYGRNEHSIAVPTGLPPMPMPSSIPQFPLAPHINGPMQLPSFNRGRLSPVPASRQMDAPPSGYRVPLTADSPFPPTDQTGQVPAYDLDGSPTYFGSALFPDSVHPCKICPAMASKCRVPYGNMELEHSGRYDLLPFRPDTMELVPARDGIVPYGRRPVEGGYEGDGAKLYHALAVVDGVKVPGKTGEHLVRFTHQSISFPK